jgi:hypothetical protein
MTHLNFYIKQISKPRSFWELTSPTENPEDFVDADADADASNNLDGCLAIRYLSWAGDRGPFVFVTSSQVHKNIHISA